MDKRADEGETEQCACTKGHDPPKEPCSQAGGCNENDFDYMVTPFPEYISNYILFNNLYLPWILLSLAFAAIRVSAMALCGEAPGRFALNIVFALLPGIQAALIIAYSKRTEETTKTFCGMADRDEEERIIDEYAKLVRRAFSNTGMLILGMVFVVVFWPMMESGQLYPTPSHNILHRKEVRDKIQVSMGASWATRSSVSDKSNGQGILTENKTWGEVELPLGKALKMGEDSESPLSDGNEESPLPDSNKNKFRAVTRPPLEDYESLDPLPTFDENLDREKYLDRLAIDPDWNKYSPEMVELKALRDHPRVSQNLNKKPEDIHTKQEADRQKKQIEEKKWKEKRAAQLISPLAAIYLRTDPADRWLLSQATYKMVMLPLLFMSGAMMWCLGGITWLTWAMGRTPKYGEKNVWKVIKVGVHPRLSRSVREVGKNLWYVAVITGSLYTIVMICMFFARPDTLTLTVSSAFSLLVVVVFIMPQFNMHQLMVNAKDRRINNLNEQLDSALEQMQSQRNKKSIEKANDIIELQKALGDCCEWPYDFKSLMMVVGSVIIPVLMAIFTLYEHFK